MEDKRTCPLRVETIFAETIEFSSKVLVIFPTWWRLCVDERIHSQSQPILLMSSWGWHSRHFRIKIPKVADSEVDTSTLKKIDIEGLFVMRLWYYWLCLRGVTNISVKPLSLRTDFAMNKYGWVTTDPSRKLRRIMINKSTSVSCQLNK